jgi:hypothetical protein
MNGRKIGVGELLGSLGADASGEAVTSLNVFRQAPGIMNERTRMVRCMWRKFRTVNPGSLLQDVGDHD